LIAAFLLPFHAGAGEYDAGMAHSTANAHRSRPQEGSAMSIDLRTIELIERIQQTPLLDKAAVERLLGVALGRPRDLGNQYLDVFVATVAEPSPVQTLELRLSKDAGRRGQALLILTLRPSPPVAVKELRDRLSAITSVEGPLAGSPQGTPTYELRDAPTGRLSIGYLPAEGDRVQELIFDRKALPR